MYFRYETKAFPIRSEYVKSMTAEDFFCAQRVIIAERSEQTRKGIFSFTRETASFNALEWTKRKPRMAGMPRGLEREDSYDFMPVLC